MMKTTVKVIYHDGTVIQREFLLQWVAEKARVSLEEIKSRYPGTIKSVEAIVNV